MRGFVFILFIIVLFGCANVVAPRGGEKDTLSPVLESFVVEKNGDKTETHITLLFDENIKPKEWENYFYISPPLQKNIEKTVKGKVLELLIKEELLDNITYSISLSECIQDVNEGNSISNLQILFSESASIDSLKLSGKMIDSYTLKPISNAWVMLYSDSVIDSLILNIPPIYISKTTTDGYFNFPNLNTNNYSIIAISGFDLNYNNNEYIAFHNQKVSADIDSFITLYGFKPVENLNSDSLDVNLSENDSIINSITDFGSLEIETEFKESIIIQMVQNENILFEKSFTTSPYIIDSLITGKYQLRCIIDSNSDMNWNTGSFEKKIQPEKVLIHPEEIMIRENWEVKIVWKINQ